MKNVYQLCTKGETFYFDSIEEIKKAGFDIKGYNKGQVKESFMGVIDRSWQEGTPQIKGFLSAMNGGKSNNKYMKNIYPKRWQDMNCNCIRYESSEVYEYLCR